MDKEIIERYKAEMMKAYNSRAIAGDNTQADDSYEDSGRLIVSVTTLRGVFPIPKALVKVFRGSLEDMSIIDSDTTNESEQTKTFYLPAPSRELSQSAGATEAVYSSYNILIEADGYVSEANLNIPIFKGVTSLQNVDMVLLSASNNGNMIINDQIESYNL